MSGSLELGSVVAFEVRKSPISENEIDVAGRVGGHVNAEHYANLAGKSDVSPERHGAGDDVGEESGVGGDAVGHDGDGEVEGAGVAGADSAGGDGDVADLVAPVAEDGVAAVVAVAHPVGVVDGDDGGEADVEEDLEPGQVDGEVQVFDGDGGDGDGGTAGLEDGEAEDEEEQAEDGRDGEADPSASASASAAGVGLRGGIHQLSRGRLSAAAAMYIHVATTPTRTH